MLEPLFAKMLNLIRKTAVLLLLSVSCINASAQLPISSVADKNANIIIGYIKVDIKTLGLCPDWHYGVGYEAWFFLDEVSVY